jgi:hypothetical protein
MVDFQLDAAHGEQKKPGLGPPRPHEVADPEFPFPDAGRFRPGQRIFYAFVIHGVSRMPSKSTRVELEKFRLFKSVQWAGSNPGAVTAARSPREI